MINYPKPAKITKEMSNFIVSQVLERSEDLIRNSYRRLTTENIARNEHWSKIAEIVSEHFEIPIDIERVKSNFHNRKKVLLARMKEELRVVCGVGGMSIDGKVAELVKRRVLIGEHDEKLAKICLEVEDEEKHRTETDFNPANNGGLQLNDITNPSLLSQLLSHASTTSVESTSELASRLNSNSPVTAGLNNDLEQVCQGSTIRAPLLSKLLTDPAGSNSENKRIDRKRRSNSWDHRNYLSNPTETYLSHLIVDVTSPSELKRLLSILIDHGFSRFQHVENIQLLNTHHSIPGSIRSTQSNHNLVSTGTAEICQGLDEIGEIDDLSRFSSNHDLLDEISNKIVAKNSEMCDPEFEVKTEPIDEEPANYEELNDGENEVDFELQISEEANKIAQKSLALFERKAERINFGPGSKRSRPDSEITIVPCELCGTQIRLNTGGSKWNLHEHVMLKHSNHKPFRCPLCPYEAGRKIRVRQHASALHDGAEVEPLDTTTPEIRKEWLNIMSKCFPQHQYGKNTIAMRIQ